MKTNHISWTTLAKNSIAALAAVSYAFAFVCVIVSSSMLNQAAFIAALVALPLVVLLRGFTMLTMLFVLKQNLANAPHGRLALLCMLMMHGNQYLELLQEISFFPGEADPSRFLATLETVTITLLSSLLMKITSAFYQKLRLPHSDPLLPNRAPITPDADPTRSSSHLDRMRTSAAQEEQPGAEMTRTGSDVV